MPRAFALALCAALTTGCLHTKYVVDDDIGSVRFDGPRADEKILRHVDEDQRRQHFLFGLISNNTEVDVAEVAGLEHGEALVNTEIESRMSPIDLLMWIGAGIPSFGIAMVIWTPYTSTIHGDVVRAGAEPAVAKTKVPATSAERQVGAPAAPKTEALGTFLLLRDAHSQSGAAAECSGRGAKLPTRAQLKEARAKDLLEDSGDVWSGEAQGDDGWIFNTASGATFLKDKGESYVAYCVKGD